LGFLRICYVSQCCRNQFIRAGFLCLFCLLSLSLPLSAQQKLLPVFHFNRLTTADGLSSNNTLSRALRDSRGYLWIGTGNGLSRYDGYGFKIYRNVLDDSTSISSSMIFAVKEDSKHRLWVGSWDAGLSLYDPTRDCFVNFHPRPGDSSWLQSRTVWAMAEDSAGVLWLGTCHGGIVRVDVPETARSGDIAVRSIAPSSGDSLWIGAAHDGLWKFDPASGKFVRGSRTLLRRANDVLKDRYGRLWVASILDGLYYTDPATDSVEHFVHDRSNPNSLSNDRTNNLFEDYTGRMSSPYTRSVITARLPFKTAFTKTAAGGSKSRTCRPPDRYSI
jgi:ligand-binding sensor domain-containing protein